MENIFLWFVAKNIFFSTCLPVYVHLLVIFPKKIHTQFWTPQYTVSCLLMTICVM